ncbi:MAG TPA: L-2-hydroxyglutarate oxidase, partial [Vicinamibacterales bacterium]
MTDGPWDVVVVGAGILGLATARELLHRAPESRVLVLERERSIAAHQTGHNSGVIHAGIYYAPGSLKAQLCTAGRDALYAYCDEHGIPYERCGKLIIALDDSERAKLDELERRGRANGVPGLRRLDAAGLREIEPHAVGVAALHSPSTGIVDFAAVARAMASEIQGMGAEIQTGVEVRRFSRVGDSTVVETSAGPIPTVRAVACAGLWSDRLAEASGESPDPRIVPFRGGYLRLRPSARELVRSLIY